MLSFKCKVCGTNLDNEDIVKPRSINIFLVDGHPNGTRIAQISMSTIQAVAFPRNQLSRIRKDFFEEVSRPGVYILYGTVDDDASSMMAYIGQSESVEKRLAHHNSAKGQKSLDFWENTVVLISKDDNLTSAHARFVEAPQVRQPRTENGHFST